MSNTFNRQSDDGGVVRVFPRRTRATPTDPLAFTEPPGLFPPVATAVHISVAFTYDIPRAEWLAREWERVAPVTIGGPAYNDRGGGFIPGMYLKPGYVFTSRGCPNNCWFCSVPRREGDIRELPVMDGWNILDSNLLACSRNHILVVLGMLARQKQRAEFTGGLEAARLQDWHVDLLAQLKPRPSVFFAFDTPDDYESLVIAGRKMLAAGFTRESHALRCYVLVGYGNDTMQKAENRLRKTWLAGFLPMAMLWRDRNGKRLPEWRTFQRHWARPASVAAMCREIKR